jgi:acyl carrier protein
MENGLETITRTVCRIGKLPALRPEEDFYAAGFSSINALELLIELESTCAVSIPDDRFVTARTAQDLHTLIHQLQQGQPS